MGSAISRGDTSQAYHVLQVRRFLFPIHSTLLLNAFFRCKSTLTMIFLQVTPNSPGEKAGLACFFDFIVAANENVLVRLLSSQGPPRILNSALQHSISNLTSIGGLEDTCLTSPQNFASSDPQSFCCALQWLLIPLEQRRFNVCRHPDLKHQRAGEASCFQRFEQH